MMTKIAQGAQRKAMTCRSQWVATVGKARGFSLVELMIALVVVSVLASIAYPSYRSYVERARRTDGVALLMDIAARQERFYTDNNTYTTTLTALGFSSTSPSSSQGHYTAAAAAGPSTSIATSYALTVTPAVTDSTCGNLTLDSRGTRGTSVSSDAAVIAKCWK
jgi:type IV pilus assembly protein PilE